jgi:archaetidylinositol phosphate synthase
MQRDIFFAKWSALHGEAEISGVVRVWLSISYQCARFLTFLRITPNTLTLLGVGAAALMAWKPFSFLTILLLTLSLFADGVDGSVAIYRGRTSNWGATLDSLADRISEALWLYVAYLVGLPAWLAIALWVVAATQEYARARAASLGHGVITVVTPTERPVRASALFIFLVGLFVGIDSAVYVMYLLFIAQCWSFFQVMRNAYQSLR